MMLDRGQDPLRIVCERARAKGMLLYPTLLVNQWLFGDSPQDDVRASNFRWKNRHLEIGAAGDLEEFPGKTHLDFKHEAVREERLAVIREVLNNYPVDGFELHLNYAGPFFFHPDQVAAGREIMSSWVAQVHQAVKASGAERELVITVPVDLERAWSRGLDVRQWIRDGSVDVLVGASHNSMDHVADFRPLVQAARGSSCRVYAGLNGQVYSDRLQNADITVARAGACNYWAQGVDGLYLDPVVRPLALPGLLLRAAPGDAPSGRDGRQGQVLLRADSGRDPASLPRATVAPAAEAGGGPGGGSRSGDRRRPAPLGRGRPGSTRCFCASGSPGPPSWTGCGSPSTGSFCPRSG